MVLPCVKKSWLSHILYVVKKDFILLMQLETKLCHALFIVENSISQNSNIGYSDLCIIWYTFKKHKTLLNATVYVLIAVFSNTEVGLLLQPTFFT